MRTIDACGPAESDFYDAHRCDRSRQIKARHLTVVAALVAVVACAGPSKLPASSANPIASSPVPAPAAPQVSLPGPGITLSGRILEVSADGTRRPISATKVAVEVEVNNPTDPERGGWIPVGTDGVYRLPGVPDNRFVKITSVDTTGRAAHYQLCGTNAVTSGDTTLDVPLFLPGAPLPTPTLSGQVFMVIDGKPMPLAGVDVYYRSRAYGPDVWSYTDSNGRYSLCGVPQIPGILYLVCGNDVEPYSKEVNVQADASIDIDATTFHSCLYPYFFQRPLSVIAAP